MIQIKKIIKIAMVAVFATTAVNSFGLNKAEAQALPKATIAIIDSARIMQDSAAGKDIERQIRQIRTEFQKEIVEITKSLKAEHGKIQKQKSTILSKEAYEAKMRAFQLKVNEQEQQKQIKEREVQIAMADASQKLAAALKPIYQKILKERKATMILDTRSIVAKSPGTGLDVTTSVLELLDASLPALKLEFKKKK
jgi:Skp family chaperone for outer membrane proteins